MATAKWWICDSCRSLNDIPANKCYKCRAQKPSHPTFIDADYMQVGSTQARVGVSVDRSKLAELTAPQPMEKRSGTGVFEAYGAMDDQPLESVRTADEPKAPPPPLREPPRRSIAQVGGFHWEQGLVEADRREEAAAQSAGPVPGSPAVPMPPGPAAMPPGAVHGPPPGPPSAAPGPSAALGPPPGWPPPGHEDPPAG